MTAPLLNLTNQALSTSTTPASTNAELIAGLNLQGEKFEGLLQLLSQELQETGLLSDEQLQQLLDGADGEEDLAELLVSLQAQLNHQLAFHDQPELEHMGLGESGTAALEEFVEGHFADLSQHDPEAQFNASLMQGRLAQLQERSEAVAQQLEQVVSQEEVDAALLPESFTSLQALEAKSGTKSATELGLVHRQQLDNHLDKVQQTQLQNLQIQEEQLKLAMQKQELLSEGKGKPEQPLLSQQGNGSAGLFADLFGDFNRQKALQESSVDGWQPQGNTAKTDLIQIQLPNTVMPNTSFEARQPNLQALVNQEMAMQTTLTDKGWGDELGDKMMWMTTRHVQSAALKLNPPELGPMDVRMVMKDNQINLVFTSQHAPVREALEQALPRLREMFQDNGLNLANVSVDSSPDGKANPESFQQFAQSDQQGQPRSSNYSASPHSGNEDLAMSPMPTLVRQMNQGLVDFYA